MAEETMADVDAVLRRAELARGVRAETLSEYEGKLQADDRSFIAKLIVWAFVLMVGVLMIATIYYKWSEWKDSATFLGGIVSSVMLPVVTLVLGYYFGKETKD